MIIMIIDTKTAVTAASAGIEICVQTLIPTLFPFLFLSALLTSSLAGTWLPITKPLCKLLKIPNNAGTIFINGLLGGYPVGAQCIAGAVESGSISRENGSRMLSFCSNAGPAFLFGIGSRLFSDIRFCWVTWGIQISSAILTAMLVPPVSIERAAESQGKKLCISGTLRKAVQSMAMICGWVILFRILLTFLQQWILWIFPAWLQVMLFGMLELTNGCYMLLQIEDLSLRFVLFSMILSFGGFCVAMQTYGICSQVKCNAYLPGKLLQSLFSMLLCVILISQEMRIPAMIMLMSILIIAKIFPFRSTKKNGNLQGSIV